MPFASHSARAPEEGVDQEEQAHRDVRPEQDAREVHAVLEHPRRGAHGPQESRCEEGAGGGQGDAEDQPERDRLDRRPRCRLLVLLAHAPGDERGRTDGESEGQRVDHRLHRLGETDGGLRLGAQPSDEEDVSDGEHRLHHHLQHHRNGEDEDGAPERRLGQVAVRAAQGLPDLGPERALGPGRCRR